MKKRSAMLVAAGLVAALLAGGTALSFSLTNGTAAASDSAMKPIVKTRHRTITIHKKAKAEPARVVTIASQPSTGAAGSIEGTSTWDEQEQEFEGEAEDQAEHASGTFEGQSGGGVESEDTGGDD